MNPTNYVLLIYSKCSLDFLTTWSFPLLKFNWRFPLCCRCCCRFILLFVYRSYGSAVFFPCRYVRSSVSAEMLSQLPRTTNILFIFMLLFSVLLLLLFFVRFCFVLYHNHKSVLNEMIPSLTNWLVLQHINHTRIKVLRWK